MRYFKVYEVSAPSVSMVEVYSDGEPDEKTRYVEDTPKLIEYVVEEYDEDGTAEDEKHYDATGYYACGDALEQIKEDHPADEWQNDKW